MLGGRVVAALAPRHRVITYAHRWPDGGLLESIEASRPDWVVNCIKGGWAENADLPHRLAERFRLIQPSTDAVSEDTEYGRSKAAGEAGTVIRCGIVDPDGGLLARVRAVPIFEADTARHWNGITALAWAGVAEAVMDGTLTDPLIVPGSPPVSIHDLAVEACYAFGWRTEVVARITQGPDRVLWPTLEMPPIADQLAAYR
jgi:hypothetical protein